MKTMTMLLLAGATAFAGDSTDDAARKLETRVSVDFRGTPMADVLEVLRGATGLNLIAVEGLQTSVTLSVRDVSAKSALRLILQPAGLGAKIEGGAVVIRSRQALEGAVTLRIYDVRSRLVKVRDFPGPRMELAGPGPICGIGCFPFFDEYSPTGITEDLLVDLIRAHTGGASWDQNPRAALSLRSGLLTVTQTPRVHREIEDFLGRLPF